MAKIYLDTNKFIGLYQAAEDSMDIFDRLEGFVSRLVLTDQTINEFRRNRVSTLGFVAKEFKKSLALNPFTTAVLRALPGHAELTSLSSTYRSKGEELLNTLRAMISDESKDPVSQRFLKLAEEQSLTRIPISDNAIDRAHRRKLLGQPPTSPDKHTIGDELIWELLCQGTNDDLVIVSKDRTFVENASLLTEEYRDRTGHRILLITDSIVSALTKLGETPPTALVKAEAGDDQGFQDWDSMPLTDKQAKAMLKKEICPRCGKTGNIQGFEGSDGDAFDWFECGACHLMFDLTGSN